MGSRTTEAPLRPPPHRRPRSSISHCPYASSWLIPVHVDSLNGTAGRVWLGLVCRINDLVVVDVDQRRPLHCPRYVLIPEVVFRAPSRDPWKRCSSVWISHDHPVRPSLLNPLRVMRGGIVRASRKREMTKQWILEFFSSGDGNFDTMLLPSSDRKCLNSFPQSTVTV